MTKTKSVVRYFLGKIQGYSITSLLRLELEAYLAWPFRSLPSFLGYVPRYIIYKLLFRQLDSFCFIQPNVFFSHCHNIKCGRNFVVNSNSYFHGIGGIEIGDYVLIGPNAVLSSGMHEYSKSREPVATQKIIPKKIVIEDGVWIGANVVVMPGVTISEGTIVGAGSVVTKSTEPYSVVAGVPAKKIKMRLN